MDTTRRDFLTAAVAAGATTAPDPGLASRYAELFAVYRATREAMIPTWDRLSELRREDRP